ncbi:NADH dehydrogenase [ubiquinone] 1 subunit C2 [Pararge aegeria]|uniref:NADH dehydrogenase [ubiquinone] 1 subunit C2 n=2 Tax=Pararge aegeria TaxID=116150 RepID=A0A8S4SIF3_9NEOP|nr:NADH dehydrogenase [ubiquinone] 1 subunit C2 [Pararge aegeria]CAH2263434.1 jg13901 [Pararge aegeria aegeria]
MTSNLSAIELLKLGNEGRIKPFLNQYWPYILGGVFGIGTGVMINFGTKRPLMSGIQKHILGVVGWTAAISVVQNKRDEYLAEKDAVLRHYIELHPEDFPTPERKKIGDLLDPWVPIR